jgi:protein-S-isoprenylcysteine O-methyltransferase Ste14
MISSAVRGWPGQLIAGLWLLWLIYWVIAAFRTKPTRQRESSWVRLAIFVWALFLVVVIRMARQAHGGLMAAVIPGGWPRYWTGVALVAAGLGFAAWARVVLAGNWSGWVVVKEGHELIEQGPYRYLRHPIYSGLILAILGSLLAIGRVRGFMVLLVLPLVWIKLRAEERLMQREFGERYTAYRASTWALIPFVF